MDLARFEAVAGQGRTDDDDVHRGLGQVPEILEPRRGLSRTCPTWIVPIVSTGAPQLKRHL